MTTPKQVGIEPPPPGETGVELTGAAAVAALDDVFKLFSQAPRVEVHIRDVDIRVSAGKVLITVNYDGADTKQFTVRLSRQWAQTVFARLGRALGL